MTEPLAISFSRLDGLSESLASATTAMRSTLEQLDERVATLSGSWTGAAAKAYAQAHADWTAALTDMANVLGQAHRVTGAVADRHRAAEKNVVALWGTS